MESSTADADLFLVVRAFAPDDEEVVFQGAIDPHTPISQGWLRASQRKLDPALATEYRPAYAHDEVQRLTPGTVYQLYIEIWPTCVVLPAGYRLALTVQFPGAGVQRLSNFKNDLRGSGPFLHDDPTDRWGCSAAGPPSTWALSTPPGSSFRSSRHGPTDGTRP